MDVVGNLNIAYRVCGVVVVFLLLLIKWLEQIRVFVVLLYNLGCQADMLGASLNRFFARKICNRSWFCFMVFFT